MSNTPPPAPFEIAAVILAAGASSRMGKPKLLLEWGSTSVVGHLVKLWRTLGAAQVVVVHSSTDKALQRELDRLSLPADCRIPNPDAGRGMFSSVQCAARWAGWKAALTHCAFVLGDQPHVSVQTLRPLLSFASAHPQDICQPSRQTRPRHPVIIPATLLPQLASTSQPNLKQFLLTQPGRVRLCELDDAALDHDLDTPEDYAKAIREFPPG